MRSARLALEKAETLKSAAGQWANPEIEAEAGFGDSLGDQQIDAQVALVQPIDIGGRRSARVQEAEAQEKQAKADVRAAEADAVIETVTRLHRVRQIDLEKALLEEAAGAFSKLVTQYRRRERLTPEQEVSLAVFEMAEADNRLKLSALIQEESAIEHFFHIATGHGLEEIRKALPERPKSWPDVTEKGDISASPTLARLHADRDLALAELESARAHSWPEIGIGPMIQLQADGPIHQQLYGLQLRFELPVFSWNGGGRAHAHKSLAVSENAIAVKRAEETHERAEQVTIYRSAVKALKDALPTALLEKRHAEIESLSVRGLVSASLAIEAHRQRAELEMTRNEREVTAIRALWTIHKLDGRIFEEIP
ncbi:MAG: TolC family protein [Bdellovibrionales bacterium]|nr:TolC family protein [Bdellovibrionales bacterium]